MGGGGMRDERALGQKFFIFMQLSWKLVKLKVGCGMFEQVKRRNWWKLIDIWATHIKDTDIQNT